MATPRLSADEKRWRAESDVRTLAEAERIKADRGRVNAAAVHAAKQAEEAKQQARALSRVARRGRK